MKGYKCGVAALAALSIGCGGGGSGESVGGSGAGDVSFGNIKTRAFVNNQPVTINSTASAAIGLVGSVSELNYKDLSNSLEETYIAYSRGRGSIYVSGPNGSDEFDQQAKSQFDAVLRLRWHPDGKRLFVVASPPNSSAYNLYSIIPFAPGTATLIQSNVVDADISPNGTQLAYLANVSGNNQVFRATITGTGDTQLTSGGFSKTSVAWARDNIIFYTQANSLESIAADGSGSTFGGFGAGSPFERLTASNDGRWLIAKKDGKVWTYPIDEGGFLGFSKDFGVTDGFLEAATIAPDNNTVIWSTTNGLYQNDVLASGSYQIKPSSDEEPTWFGLSWQPFGSSTLLVGNGGRYGSTASGFIYTQRASQSGQFGSIVLFTATTPSSAKLSAEVSTSNSPYLTYVVEMDQIAKMSMTTGKTMIFSNVVGSPGGANGAVVSINSQTGRVATVIPYNISRSGKPTVTATADGVKVEGDLLGVFDGTGKNVATGGASVVELGAGGLQVR